MRRAVSGLGRVAHAHSCVTLEGPRGAVGHREARVYHHGFLGSHLQHSLSHKSHWWSNCTRKPVIYQHERYWTNEGRTVIDYNEVTVCSIIQYIGRQSDLRDDGSPLRDSFVASDYQ